MEFSVGTGRWKFIGHQNVRAIPQSKALEKWNTISTKFKTNNVSKFTKWGSKTLTVMVTFSTRKGERKPVQCGKTVRGGTQQVISAKITVKVQWYRKLGYCMLKLENSVSHVDHRHQQPIPNNLKKISSSYFNKMTDAFICVMPYPNPASGLGK